MRTVVLGGGVQGVATAWYLRRLGHEVTVIERASAAAMETSFGNAGELTFSFTAPWAAPGVPKKVLTWFAKRHSPLIIRPDGTRFQLEWLKMMFDQCRADRFRTNLERMVRIAEYSRSLFEHFAEENGIAFEGRRKGTLQIFRNGKALAAAREEYAMLSEFGVVYREVDAGGCTEYEPALQHKAGSLAGGIHMPNDRTGDCFLFTQALAEKCAGEGVRFAFSHEIERFDTAAGRIAAVYAGGKRFEADHFVCCLGAFSRPVLAQIGLDLPIYPVKGYSLTIPVTNDAAAPVSTILDESYKVAITRFDKRIRIGGMAELSGYRLSLPAARRDTLLHVVRDLFPQGGDWQHIQFWSGLRPSTPDGTPIVGRCAWDNLTLNTGHGTFGWTMSLGSAKLAADLASGITPAVRTDDLDVRRYGK